MKNQDLESADFKTYERICKAFKQITGNNFNVIPDKKNNVELCFGCDGDWKRADACGLGLSDVLVMLIFTLDFDYSFLLIEEPECHLHPDMQRKLLYFFRECKDKQFLITTHSNIFLDNALIDRVFFCTFKTNVDVSDATRRASILDDLGYSIADNLVSDLVVLVEGPKDIPIIEEYLLKRGLYQAYDIKLWPLGGDIMDQVDLSVFAQGYRIIGVIDKDPGSAAVRKRFLVKCEEQNIEVFKLERYAIENYFSLRALREVFGSQISDAVVDLDSGKKLEEQIGINVKNKNRILAKTMTLDEIKDTDLYKFLLRVEELLIGK